jgi:hypothetical protein
MKEYSIAQILHVAADKHLAAKPSEYWSNGGRKEKFSCCAMHEAVISLNRTFTTSEIEVVIDRISEGLKAMGCPVDSVDAFDDSGDFSAENQQARYTWLKFAAIIAEEQGV